MAGDESGIGVPQCRLCNVDSLRGSARTDDLTETGWAQSGVHRAQRGGSQTRDAAAARTPDGPYGVQHGSCNSSTPVRAGRARLPRSIASLRPLPVGRCRCCHPPCSDPILHDTSSSSLLYSMLQRLLVCDERLGCLPLSIPFPTYPSPLPTLRSGGAYSAHVEFDYFIESAAQQP